MSVAAVDERIPEAGELSTQAVGASEMRPLLLIEQTLGHRTHGTNLRAAAETAPFRPRLANVEFTARGRLPIPWAIRGSWRSLRLARRARRQTSIAFFHTQTISLFAPFARTPYVVSTDATPIQLDTMAKWYEHDTSNPQAEWFKRQCYRQVLRHARAVVSWSEWAAQSLVDDYGVSRDRILVAHPGAPRSLFEIERGERRPGPIRILFVGGDFERKGGKHLLEAFAPLRDRAELVLMTEAAVPATDSVRTERGIRPGMPRFRELWQEADIFCLPTLGDCTPLAIGEALAAGLPVVTTRVGSNEETIREGETGLLVPVADPAALQVALAHLVDGHALREQMSIAARTDAQERFDSEKNARRILDLLRDLVPCR